MVDGKGKQLQIDALGVCVKYLDYVSLHHNMFKRRSKKKKDESPSVELTGFSAPAWKKPPSKDNTQLVSAQKGTSSRRKTKNRKSLPKRSIKNQDTSVQPTVVESRDANSRVLPEQLIISESRDIGPEQPTIVESRNAGREVLPKQPVSMESQDGEALPPIPIESQEAKKTAKDPSSYQSLLPLKARSTRSRGMVVTSTSFGMADDLECDCEHETMEIEFDTFSADEHSGLKYPSIVRRKRTDTVTSLRIDSSYDL